MSTRRKAQSVARKQPPRILYALHSDEADGNWNPENVLFNEEQAEAIRRLVKDELRHDLEVIPVNVNFQFNNFDD